MSVDLRFPNITAQDEKGQLIQMKSYLHQLVEQLQWALNSTDAQNSHHVVAGTKNYGANADTSNPIDRATTFNAIKSLIITSADIVEAYYEEINKKLSGLYVAESEFGAFVEETRNNIAANSTNITQNYTDTQTVIGGLESDIGGMSTELVGVKESVASLNGSYTSVSSRLESVSGELTNVSGRVDTVSGNVTEVSDKANAVEKVLDKATTETQTALGDLSSELGGVKENTDKLSGDISDVTERVGTVESSIDGLSTELGNVDGKVNDVSDRLDSAENALSEVEIYVKTTKANIKSGLLYYDDEGTPIYGVEVGQENEINGVTVFRKYARFISNRLSFYDENDNEVAYISDRKLHITDVEVTGSYKIGDLRDYVRTSGSVVTKYVGR